MTVHEPGTIVLAVLGAADARSIDDLVGKGTALLGFDTVSVLLIDLRAATGIAPDVAHRFVALLRHARRVGREIRFRSVPDHLFDMVRRIEYAAAG